jgi:hypothetical protein
MSFKSPAFGGLELADFRLRNTLRWREFPGILTRVCMRAAAWLQAIARFCAGFRVILRAEGAS